VIITDAYSIVTCPGRNYVAYKIKTDEGIYGVGDATLNGRELVVANALDEYITPLLIGRNPDNIEDIWQNIYRGTYWRGGPVLNSALSAVDIALWDIKGKKLDQPVYQLLGGRTRMGALAYTHCAGNTKEEVVNSIGSALSQGFRAVRAQITIDGVSSTYGQGGAMEATLATWGDASLPMEERWEPDPYLTAIPELFKYLGQNLGDGVVLLHDAHERLTPTQAARLARELEPYHLFYLEDPLRPEHKPSLRRIREASVTPIAMGELYSSVSECIEPITNQYIDYIRCGLTHVGGITAARKIANLAEPFSVKTAWHGPGDASPIAHAASVHVDISIPNFGIQEMVEFPEVVQEVFPGGPVFSDGYLDVQDKPGLGTDVNEEAAAKYPYRRAYLPNARLTDGSVLDW